ncbi:hypothetical protein MKW92_011868 [Papaver armeniacum]|nr:hypothetical protein MKW92_011868 [Papaver armeniacum]
MAYGKMNSKILGLIGVLSMFGRIPLYISIAINQFRLAVHMEELIGSRYRRVVEKIRLTSHRCVESGVSYLDSKLERIGEAEDGHRHVACESGIVIPCRLVTVASGAAFRETFGV